MKYGQNIFLYFSEMANLLRKMIVYLHVGTVESNTWIKFEKIFVLLLLNPKCVYFYTPNC